MNPLANRASQQRCPVRCRRGSGLNITDFRPAVNDIYLYLGDRSDTFEEVMAAASQQGSDLVFDFFPEVIKELPSLVLEEVLLIKLTPDNIRFDDY